MSQAERANRTQEQLRGSLIGGGVIGAAGAAALTASLGWPWWALAALAGAMAFGALEAITSATTTPGLPKPLWHRTLASALLFAVFGWVLGLIFGTGEPVIFGVVIGGLLGLMGLRLTKIALGLAVGAAVGLAFWLLAEDVELAILAASVTVVYRSVSAFVYRGRSLVRVMGARVAADDVRYVVPFEARSRYVGADYVEQLARVEGGTFRRNPPDVGIVESLDSLSGPAFEPAAVDPLIREFYEHTSRFSLSIVPRWRPWIRPAYAAFKSLVAEPLGQATIPSNIEEAQRGMVSTIDTVDLEGRSGIDIRGWVRTYADSGKPIYVGIYTTFRHEERGYVSVGFPLPDANFTATLLPRNDGDGLVL
ncbi:MAG: hypothetical protein ACR2N5_05025, partial [Solirubrobacterales bacterium]